MEFEIAPGRLVGGRNSCFIIAEIGQNHQGDVELAKKLIKIAKDSGADCVKLQKSHLRSRFTSQVLNRPYDSVNSWGSSYGEHRNKLELSDDSFRLLRQYCKDIDIYFTASGMDKCSMNFLSTLDVPFFKIGSADTTNLPLLRYLSQYQKPLVISTGMTHIKDIQIMYDEVSKFNKCVAFLQCTSCYPTPDEYVNLNVLKTFKDLFPKAVIGYSGHELGTEVSLAAVACGAKILERHITLDKSLKGSDHSASLEPVELKRLVDGVRRIESAMGSPNKIFEQCEFLCYEKLGKTLVASRYIKKGTVMTEDMIDVKVAVEKVFNPIQIDQLIGRKALRDINEEETINSSDVDLT